jgi:hypothetical protein
MERKKVETLYYKLPLLRSINLIIKLYIDLKKTFYNLDYSY